MVQFSSAVCDARNNATRDAIGSAPTLTIFNLGSSPPPANCAAADVGTVLATLTLPSDWLGTSSGGVINLGSVWAGTVTTAGTAQFFRIYQGSTCHMQGTVTAIGGGGDIELSSATLPVDATITIDVFSMTG